MASLFSMNARELNGSPMSLGKEVKFMCKYDRRHEQLWKLTIIVSLSSVVILISLALAFSTWARTLIAVGGRVIYAYVTHWMGIHKIPIWTFRGTATLQDFEKRTVIELRRKALLKRIKEINAVINQPEEEEPDRRGSWASAINGRGFRKRKTTTHETELP